MLTGQVRGTGVTPLSASWMATTSTTIAVFCRWHMPSTRHRRLPVFICHSRDNTAHLDRHHTCFGKVYEGVEVIDQIRQGDEIEKILIFED